MRVSFRRLLERWGPEEFGLTIGASAWLGLSMLAGAWFWLVDDVAATSASVYLAAAQIGATLLVAFALEVGLLFKGPADATTYERRAVVAGGLAGAGLGGLVAVVLSIACAQRLEAAGDLPGLWWLAASVAAGGLLMLGIVVALLPLVWHWRSAPPPSASDEEG